MRSSPAPGVAGLLVAVVAVVLATVATATPAAAHAEFVSSSPAGGARLPSLPSTVRLTFSETMRTPAFVVVTAADGTEVASGQAETLDAEVIQEVTGSAGPGEYAVSYRVTSADGHPVSGTVRFVVRGGAGAGQTGQGGDAEEAGSGAGTGRLALLVAALALGLVALGLGTRRALRPPSGAQPPEGSRESRR